jgi:molybdopterin/thiamine biosynthesis adenylyltransferase
VVVVGCGALGATAAEQLCRAGVGHLRLIDRDFVDSSNLQRQSLYTEEDAALSRPKAVAAAMHLRRLNSACDIAGQVVEVRASTIRAIIAGAAVVVDGTDNFPTRHLINEACVQAQIPWIYGACVGAYGVSLPIIPQETPCLGCLQDALPSAGDNPTCDTVGIIAPAVHVVAAWQVAEALKILVGDMKAVRRELWATDLWTNRFQHLDLTGGRDAGCAVCGPVPTFPRLNAKEEAAVVLCGRDAVQLRHAIQPDLDRLAAQLGPHLLLANEYLVRWRDGAITGTCFRDGRVLVQGVQDAVMARNFCDRWMG